MLVVLVLCNVLKKKHLLINTGNLYDSDFCPYMAKSKSDLSCYNVKPYQRRCRIERL